MKTFSISGVSAGTRWIQIHSTTSVKAHQISGRVITWYNVVSYLAWIIFSDIRRQWSVKRVRLFVKAKPKIHDNLFHREHRTRRHNPHSIIQNLPQMLTTPPPPGPDCCTTTSSQSRTGRCEEKGRKLYCKKYIYSTIVYFDLLNSNDNNNHAIHRFFTFSVPILYIFYL